VLLLLQFVPCTHMKVRIKDLPSPSPAVTSNDNAEATGESAKAIDTSREMAPTTRLMFVALIVQLDDICKENLRQRQIICWINWGLGHLVSINLKN
jgi:hypothetical protein